jgi:hypothetical protein
MRIIDRLLPRFSYRRLAASLTWQQLRGRVELRRRLVPQNWRYFRIYASAPLVCNVCGCTGPAFFDFPDLELRREHRIGELRETLQCRHCGATMRHRTLAHAILTLVSAVHGKPVASIAEAAKLSLAGLRVLDSDSFSPISERLRPLDNYVRSSYVADRPFGTELEHNRFNVDLERMHFPDASFDMVLTSDVAEHIRDIDAAHREIARVLRPGGHYVFTVPYDPCCPTHHVLVDTSGPEDVFLVPKQIHGDPLTGGILAYRVFGRAIFEDLAHVGLQARFQQVDDDRALILGGDVFIATK